MPDDDGTLSGDTIATALVQPQSSPAHTRFRLSVIDGPDAGTSFVVDASSSPRVYVGQGPSCEFRLTDDRASRRHLALTLTDAGLRVVDLESTNGTYIDNVRVFDALVEGSATLRLGATAIRVDAETTTDVVALSQATSFGTIVGTSAEMRRLYPLCAKLAASDVAVVIEGETGTGKEVLAESIHAESKRAEGPFVVFDCTAVPPTLVESELFGHERGAFTGAVATRHGVFEQASGGTLLIDEIGDLDLALQPKLLRVLQRGEVRRVGGDRWIKVDVRVMAATRRDLDRAVQDGRFRDDLYFRLAVARLELPPLRIRRGDISILTNHFWRQLNGEGAPPYELLRRFERHDWPGNVRELANAVARHLALGELSGAPPATRAAANIIDEVLASDLPFPRARDRVLAEFEKRFLERMLSLHDGNVTNAAKASGIGRRYFTAIAARHSGND